MPPISDILRLDFYVGPVCRMSRTYAVQISIEQGFVFLQEISDAFCSKVLHGTF